MYVMLQSGESVQKMCDAIEQWECSRDVGDAIQSGKSVQEMFVMRQSGESVQEMFVWSTTVVWSRRQDAARLSAWSSQVPAQNERHLQQARLAR